MSNNYEVDKPEIQATLREIAEKIGKPLPAGWGFLLMLFEYGSPGNPGANFYISSAERASVITMVREWLARQEREMKDAVHEQPIDGEINPDHMTTKRMRENWHKIVGLLLTALAPNERFVITSEMLDKLGQRNIAVAVKPQGSELLVYIVSEDEARELAAQGLAEEGQVS